MVSDALKRSLAEREARREPRAQLKHDKAVDDLFAMIDRAAPFINEGCDPKAWRPSDKLKLIYLGVATSPSYTVGKLIEAFMLIDQLLDKSRKLWTMGLHPDPFRDAESPFS